MDWPRDWIGDYLVRQIDDPARSPYLGFVDELPIGYLEVYDPFRDVLGAHAPVLPGDLGAHVLIGDEEHLGRYSVALGRAVMRMLFRRPGVLRIVGEPDVRNENFLSLLAFLGFRKQAEIELPDKRAAFMVCERADFERLASRRRRVTRVTDTLVMTGVVKSLRPRGARARRRRARRRRRSRHGAARAQRGRQEHARLARSRLDAARRRQRAGARPGPGRPRRARGAPPDRAGPAGDRRLPAADGERRTCAASPSCTAPARARRGRAPPSCSSRSR